MAFIAGLLMLGGFVLTGVSIGYIIFEVYMIIQNEGDK